MSERTVTFYLSETDFLSIGIKLCEKLYESGEKVLYLTSSSEETKFTDSKLWTFSKLSFIPHGSKYSVLTENIPFCKIWISENIETVNDPSCIIHSGIDLQNICLLKSFQKIIDISSINDKKSIPERSNAYKKIGFDNQKLWIQCKGAWQSGEIEQL